MVSLDTFLKENKKLNLVRVLYQSQGCVTRPCPLHIATTRGHYLSTVTWIFYFQTHRYLRSMSNSFVSLRSVLDLHLQGILLMFY